MTIATKIMETDFPIHQNKVGVDIRALRKSRNITLSQMALKLGRSVGFLSQIERGISEPSISDIRNIANLFDVPVSFFFHDNFKQSGTNQHIVKSAERRRLGSSDTGLTEELLSPDLSGSFEIIRSEFAPGAKLEKPELRETEEAGFVVSGELEIEISGEWNTLQTGDSFRFAAEPYRWRNSSDQPAVVIWVISPPVY